MQVTVYRAFLFLGLMKMLNNNLSKIIEMVENADYLPRPENKQGIYFLYKDDQMVYVGITMISVTSRLLQHKDKDWNRYKFIELPTLSKQKLEAIEKIIITIYSPVENKEHLPKWMQEFRNTIQELSEMD